MFILNGKKINVDAAMTLSDPVTGEGTQYPAGWFHDAGARASAGITEVADPIRPDDRFNLITENDDGSLTILAKPIDALMKGVYKTQIDQACGAKRAVVVSPGEYIAEEYRLAYDDAMAYKAAGYAGTVPSGVQSWATASGMAANAAADDIIATRTTYMALLDAIRAIRLTGKAAVDAATTPDAILAAVDAVHTGLAAL